MLATTLTALTLSERRAAQRYGETIQLDTTADSAIRLTLLDLFMPPQGGATTRAGQEQSIDVAGTTALVEVEREMGRIDLNTADPQIIYALFAGNGWTEEAAHRIADRIADWKDPDDVVTGSDGAERGQYILAGRNYLPRDGAFQSVDELRQVLGAEDIDDALFDAFTVYSRVNAPPYSIASASVRKAIEFADRNQLGGHRWLNGGGLGRSVVGGPQMSSGASALVGEVIRIRACARSEKLQRCRVCVARVTGSAERPFQIFAWQTIFVRAREVVPTR
jgi:hypothetical protein